MPFSAYTRRLARDEIIDRVITISLHTDDPGPDGVDNEVPTAGGSGYGRQAINIADWTAAVDTTTAENTNAIDYGNAGTAWGMLIWYGVWDGANFMGRRQFAVPMNVVVNAPVTILAGSIDLSFSSVDV